MSSESLPVSVSARGVEGSSVVETVCGLATGRWKDEQPENSEVSPLELVAVPTMTPSTGGACTLMGRSKLTVPDEGTTRSTHAT